MLEAEVKPKPIPLVVVSDAPNLPTGLARIARDLAGMLHTQREELGILPLQLGWGYDGSPWPWSVFPMINEKEWGGGSLERVFGWLSEPEKMIVLTVWDAGRCYGLLDGLLHGATLRDRLALWGYFPVDSHNPDGKIGGPGGAVLKQYDRVLGYGRWGAQILEETRGERVGWMPHGVDMRVFGPCDPQVGGENMWLAAMAEASEGGVLVGGVATNQPRKDLPLFFATAARLRQKWGHLSLWLHTDKQVSKAWSIPELAELYGFNNSSFFLTEHQATDEELACAYSLCHVTLAPGGGEGFGYPIVESLACGTPVIHGSYGGGSELIPVGEWKIAPLVLRVSESVACLRPVYSPESWAEKAAEAIAWKMKEPEVVRAYCRGAVAYLDWGALEPRWVGWFRRGIAKCQE